MKDEFQERKMQLASRVLVVIATAVFLLTLLSAVGLTLLGTVTMLRSLAAAGAPDTTALASGITITIYFSFALTLLLILSIIFQLIILRHSEYLRPWIWWIMFLSSLLSVLSAIYPFNPVNLLLAIAFCVTIFIRRSFYFEKKGVS